MALAGQSCDVVVVGAGPAGLSAAVAAALSGCKTVLLEALPSPGTRLLLTGGGRCNLTNTLSPSAMADAFGDRSRFVRDAISAFPPESLRAFLDAIGVPTRCADGFHVFPASRSARDVLTAIQKEAAAAGVAAFNRSAALAIALSGEVLDVDGPCGGYNLQWAFSSGRVAGISAAK